MNSKTPIKPELAEEKELFDNDSVKGLNSYGIENELNSQGDFIFS